MRIERFTSEAAGVVSQWVYEPPFEIYSSSPSLYADLLADRGDGLGYFAITLDTSDTPIGFCCFGAEARVVNEPAPDRDTLDIGGGVAPDKVSQRFGTRFLPAVIELGIRLHRPTSLRVAVAQFNDRSLALCRSAGFVDRSSFVGPGDRVFIELYRSATT